MPEINYFDLTTDLSKVYLEDSYVLGVVENENSITFQMEVVLTERHPFYSSPKPSEQYCYKKGEITFPNTKEVNWILKLFKPSDDSSGEIDYGNIDSFVLEGGKYHLMGEWGEILIESEIPILTFKTNE